VLNILPKFNVVILFNPVPANIPVILVTFPVLNFSPKSNLVIAFEPVNLNILDISTTLPTFSKPMPEIVSEEVHFSEFPIQLNK